MSIHTLSGGMKMNKINGYTEDEAKNLVRYICEGRKEGKTLSGMFDGYEIGRASCRERVYHDV